MKSTMKSSFAIIAVALMVMVAIVPMAVVFTGEDSSAALTAFTAGEEYTVSGTVSDQGAAYTFAGATVTLTIGTAAVLDNDNYLTVNTVAKKTLDSNTWTVDTDENGDYSFTIVSTGDVTPNAVGTAIEAAAPWSAAEAAVATLGGANYNADADIKTAEFLCTVNVKDAGTAALSGVSIALTKGKSLTNTTSVTTDASGNAKVVSELDTNQKVVGTATKTGYTLDAVNIANAATQAYQNIVATEYTLTVNALNLSGNPIGGATAEITDGVATLLNATSAVDGIFKLTAAAGATPTVTVTYDGETDDAVFAAIASNATENVILNVVAVKITGFVYDKNGVGVAGVHINANGIDSAVTESDGSYTITGFSDGTVIAPATGTYKIAEITINGVYKGINFDQTTAQQFTVSGIVKDSSTAPVVLGGVTVGYKVNGTEKTATTEADGTYSFRVPLGSEVIITGFKYDQDAYTFPAYTATYEDVSAAIVVPEIDAYQKTVTVQLDNAGVTNVSYMKGLSVDAKWYRQDADTTSGTVYKYTVATSGTAKVAAVAGIDGKVKIAYTMPNQETNITNHVYTYMLVVSGIAGAPFTFVTSTVPASQNDTNWTVPVASTGMAASAAAAMPSADLTELSIRTAETIVTATIKSANAADLNGVKFTTVTSGNYSLTGAAVQYSGQTTATVLNGGESVNGVVAIAYKLTLPTSGTVRYIIVANPTDGAGYSFNRLTSTDTAVTNGSAVWYTAADVTPETVPPIAMTVGQGAIVAKENTYDVTVNVKNGGANLNNVSLKYTLDGADVEVYGNAPFTVKVPANKALTNIAVNVTDKKVKNAGGSEVNNTYYGYLFKPVTVSPGIIDGAKTVDITQQAAAETKQIYIYGLDRGDSFTVSYTVEEVVAAAAQTITGKAAGYATLVEIPGVLATADFEYTVTAAGYTPMNKTGSVMAKDLSVKFIATNDGSIVPFATVGYQVYADEALTPIVDYATADAKGEFTITIPYGYTIELTDGTEFAGHAVTKVIASAGSVYLYNAAPLAPVAGNVTVKFYATDVEGHANQQITADQIQELSVGDTCTVSTKDIDGYTFVGWYIGGDLKSESLKYTFTVDGPATVFALYSLDPASDPEPEVITEQAFDSLTLIVGFIAIIIAIIGLALVIINKKQ